MSRITLAFFIFCAACSVAPQPGSLQTVAAYEVPLPTATDKSDFIETLKSTSKHFGYHVDAASPTELTQLSEVSGITMNATVRLGNRDELIASAMDFEDRIGRVWISFAKTEDPQRSGAFRKLLMPEIRKRWPETASLPIMPTGAIPLTDDLIRTPSGYEVKASAISRYQLRPNKN